MAERVRSLREFNFDVNENREVEITLEDEKHTFSVHSCVIIPTGMQHGPIVTKSVENPFGMYMVRLDKGDASDINPA